MSMNHTPGPWVVNTAGSALGGMPFEITEIYVYAPHTQDDTAICADVIDPITQEPSEANARLISAAPDLLEALKDLKAAIRSRGFIPTVRALAKTDAAIAKATGETP